MVINISACFVLVLFEQRHSKQCFWYIVCLCYLCKGILNNVFDISFVYVDNVMDNNKVFMSYFFSFYPGIVVVLFLLTFTFLFLLRLSFLQDATQLPNLTIVIEKQNIIDCSITQQSSRNIKLQYSFLGMFYYPCTKTIIIQILFVCYDDILLHVM